MNSPFNYVVGVRLHMMVGRLHFNTKPDYYVLRAPFTMIEPQYTTYPHYYGLYIIYKVNERVYYRCLQQEENIHLDIQSLKMLVTGEG